MVGMVLNIWMHPVQGISHFERIVAALVANSQSTRRQWNCDDEKLTAGNYRRVTAQATYRRSGTAFRPGHFTCLYF